MFRRLFIEIEFYFFPHLMDSKFFAVLFKKKIVKHNTFFHTDIIIISLVANFRFKFSLVAIPYCKLLENAAFPAVMFN